MKLRTRIAALVALALLVAATLVAPVGAAVAAGSTSTLSPTAPAYRICIDWGAGWVTCFSL